MTFGEAIERARGGLRIQRAGWNGKGMWVALMPGGHLDADPILNPLEWTQDIADDTVIEPCFVLFTAQRTLQPGWLASQADLLATDWQVVER